MSLRINTNTSALTAHRNLTAVDAKLNQSIERLSTGLRINRAADNASDMTIADSLRSQALGTGQAMRNASDGISILQTADGALQESINIINTIKTKSIQAASDGQTSETRRAIQGDIDKLMEELDAIAKTTSFNGQKLLSGAFTNKFFQIGANANEVAKVSIGSTEKHKLGHMKSAQLHLASGNGGDIQLSLTSSLSGEVLTMNSIELASDNDAAHGMGALADEVNRYAAVTGIKAVAVVESSTSEAVQKGTTGDDFAINGVVLGAIHTDANDASGSLARAINNQSSKTGVIANVSSDGRLMLASTDKRTIDISGSISDVFGDTASAMSTFGYLQLTKKGASQFNLEGIGGGATGGDIHISQELSTLETSFLATGSTIAAGSILGAGSQIGGAAYVESVSSGIGLTSSMTRGSSLQYSSIIAKGTVLGANVIISGNTQDNAAALNAMTMVEQDMTVAEGSTLRKHSLLGVGTVISTDFSSGGTDYRKGDVLTSQVRLDKDLTLQDNMVLAYHSNTNHNSGLKAGSFINAGSTAGAALSIGATRDDTSGAVSIIASAGGSSTSTADLYLGGGDVSVNGQFLFQEGSLLKNGTILAIQSTGAWSGPTLKTTFGMIEQGDSISTAQLIMLDGDQILSEDFTTFQTTAAAQTLKSGSILTTGFQMKSSGGFTSNDFLDVQLDAAMLTADMSLNPGTTLQAGSKLLSGSIVGAATYISGGVDSNGMATRLETTARTRLEAGSRLENGSVLAEGSTIGGSAKLQKNTNITSEMTLKQGSFLSYGSILKKGTTLSQDMDLYTTQNSVGATINVNYTGFSAPAQAAFEYAVSVWEGLLSSSVDITIDANYTTLAVGVLGSALSNGSVLGSNITGAEQTTANYAMALANAIDGVDHNGAAAEINANFNDTGINWYFGTDGNPGGAQYDFVSVVMHEIGHGLGFASNVTSTGAMATGAPAIFDFFAQDALTGDVLANMGVPERVDAITSQSIPNQLSWNGAFGQDAAGGNPVLFTPDPWQAGSSVSHLDETTYNGTANALMTPALGNGEAIHDPGAIAMGMLQDMGWRAAAGDLVSLKAGDVLSDDMKIGQNGLTLAEDQVLKTGSKVAVNSVLATNTSNSGAVAIEKETLQKLADVNVLTQEGAQTAIDLADYALQDLDATRAGLGSVQNQFVSTISNLAVMTTNLKSSESVIRDIDFADEIMNFSQLKLVQTSSSFALGKANTSSQNILSLLQ